MEKFVGDRFELSLARQAILREPEVKLRLNISQSAPGNEPLTIFDLQRRANLPKLQNAIAVEANICSSNLKKKFA